MAELTDHARACEMDFVILFADDDRVYTRDRVGPGGEQLHLAEDR